MQSFSTLCIVPLLIAFLAYPVVGQFVPGSSNSSGWNIPFPSTLACNPNESNKSFGTLSWCHYNNPFILSDFLSRNSSDLTTNSQGSDQKSSFQLQMFCDGQPVDGKTFVNASNLSSIYASCTAIQGIEGGSAGVIDLNGTVLHMTNYMTFADLSGQLLFVFFNNNTMARNIGLNVSNVNDFDITMVQYVGESENGPVIYQDMVVFLTNSTSANMFSVYGENGSHTDVCTLFTFPPDQVDMYDIRLEGTSFYPTRPNSTQDLISLAWFSSLNLTKISNPSYPWMNSVFYYEVNAVPTTQGIIRSFLEECPQRTPMGIQLWIQVYAFRPCKFVTLHNRASNMSFMVIYTKRGVTLFNIDYTGESQQEPPYNKTVYSKVIRGLVDWCDSRPVYDPDTNTTNNVSRQNYTIFCSPDEDTEVDHVEMISPDAWSDIGTYNKVIWLMISLHNKTNTFIHVIGLTEFAFLPNANSTFENPLGLPAENPCDVNTQVYNPGHSNICVPRTTANYTLKNNIPITQAQGMVILADRPTTTTGNNSDGSSQGWVSQDHALFFASQGNEVTVFAMYSHGLDNATSFYLAFQDYNTISFLGNVTNFYASENGMHLLTAVSRQAWELESQTRYTNICSDIAANPNDLFLESFKDSCSAMPPQEVNLNSFTQYASYCSYNLYCPSLDQLQVSVPPDKQYADRPAVSKVCPKGFFCVAGQKVECPQGFYCDEEGLSQPKRCPNPVNSNSTCSQPGLIEPLSCPPGTICSLPHIPGIPAPPGFEVPSPPAQKKSFRECPAGSWCTLGAQGPIENSTIFTNSTFLCPSNTYCSTASVLEPTICECKMINGTSVVISSNGTLLPCEGRTLYCPVGTTNVNWCPAGFYCTSPNESFPCSVTQYCDVGTFAPILCPAGTFCPTPDVSVECPGGHYCPEGSQYPLPCNILVICPPGSSAQSKSLVVLAVLIGVIGGVLIGFCIFTRYNKRKQLEAESVGIISNEIRQYLAKGGDEEEEFPPSRDASASKRSVVKASRAIETATSDNNEAHLNQPIMQEGDTGVISIPTSRFQTPTIRFENMGLRLEVGEAKGKLVLDNVTGVIHPGSFVAVMGPSGSGKSTFMHTLAGKAFYGTRLGHVYVNNDEVDLNRFSKIVGFVKQDDIMLREMTVAETLLFNARMRYDPLSIDSPEGIANAMLTALDLNHVRNINIGDEKKRGISGGQRKRVNIGMELVALPSILFLDEPTSGLDSSSSMCVCSALRDMASVGITVIAVIHQPRYEIFNMFHRVLLLAKGGKLVYYGAPGDALKYFEEYIGIKCPPHVNPPDFFMDVISGEVNELGLSIDDMVEKWNVFVSSSGKPPSPLADPVQVDPYEQRKARPGGGYNSVMHLSDGTDHIVSGATLASQAQKKEIAGFFAQLWHFTTRSFVQLSRDVIWFFTDLMLVFVAGFFLGLVFSESTYQPPLPQQIVNRSLSGFGATPPPLLSEFFARPVDDPIISEASLTCMAIGMTGVTAALRVFGNEQIVYWREASAGMSTSAYFLAKNISHIFFILLSPLLYLAPFLTFVSARASFLSYYRVLVVLQFATTGLGYLVSIVVPGGLAQLAGVVVVLVFSMFGGSRPTLVQIKSMFVLLQAMPYASYIRWAQEALYLEEIREWGQVVNIQPSLNLFDYHLDDYQLCMVLTLVFGVIFRVLALVAMTTLHRDQKH